jgi:hypothetical protein
LNPSNENPVSSLCFQMRNLYRYSLEEPETEPNVLCGVDCSAYPIFSNARVLRAAAFAERWHHGQYRRSGQPYVTHCVEAARILAALLPPTAESRKYVDAVVACILHDVVDDTECDIEDVRGEFGSRVAKLVSDVSTLGKLPEILRRYQRLDVDSVMELEELVTLRKLLLVMVDDPRVFLIKIADRLHNMRTMYAVNPAKGKFVANETLQVWCSFAEQLGMFGAKGEMEDLSFAVVDPQAFRAVTNARVREWVANDVASPGGAGAGIRSSIKAAAKVKAAAKLVEAGAEEGAAAPSDSDSSDSDSEEEGAATLYNFAEAGSAESAAGAGAASATALKEFARGWMWSPTSPDSDGSDAATTEKDAAAAADDAAAAAAADDAAADAPLPRFKLAWTWEPPTGSDVQMLVERVMRGENAGTPRKGDRGRHDLSPEEAVRQVRVAAAATVREEERAKRAKPLTPEQDELRAMLACVPPFDLMQASNRNSKSAAAAAAAAAAADAATAATAYGAPAATATAAAAEAGSSGGGDASLSEDVRSMVGGASLEASLLALRSCQDAVKKVLRLDSIAPVGLCTSCIQFDPRELQTAWFQPLQPET